MAHLDDILDLAEQLPDTFRSRPIPSELPLMFGGQVAGQALMAASRTVDPTYRVHSVHAYFLRSGRIFDPTDFTVDRIRDGGSFCTRRVTGLQGSEAIFTMMTSFHRGDHGFSHQGAIPVVPAPKDLAGGEDHARRAEWGAVGSTLGPRGSGSSTRQQLWIRHHEKLSDDPVVHACAVTYISDIDLLATSILPHPDRPVQGVSLDHTLWFLRDFRADDWLLYDQVSPSSESGRALVSGRLFDSAGRLVAAAAQEGMVRFAR
ncbi:acyl-CoA thioesterase II [Rhodococcus sp. IEGM 1307]|uniref:acyl-CoA thioesterase n=1 Tax=Rhodococcus sp. IEGM 1307 TaxID=3047091 RepID=UPI0024B72341|nr:acyl-CoA thioesterase II [Rhodococcus sp. IEGM 1307]MDI9979400.1 acyl-CoA thioesterase II [Rhodococcus sp. IEGM 1307]